MTNEEKIIELAKMDGMQEAKGWDNQWIKPYLSSYDAIIPLVHKYITNDDNITRFGCVCFQTKEQTGKLTLIQFTPLELADALLKAKGFEV